MINLVKGYSETVSLLLFYLRTFDDAILSALTPAAWTAMSNMRSERRPRRQQRSAWLPGRAQAAAGALHSVMSSLDLEVSNDYRMMAAVKT